jgi:hypothetical protein
MKDRKNIITIDLEKWETQQDAASKRIGKYGKPVSIQYISKLVKTNKINSFPIPQLNLVLVEKLNK